MKWLRNYLWKRWLRRQGVKLSLGPNGLAKHSTLHLETPVALGDVEITARSLRIGAHTYMRSGSLLMVGEIGRFCSIGQGVVIGQDPHGHPLSWLSSHPFQYDGNIAGSAPRYSYACAWADAEIGMMSGLMRMP